MEEEDGLKTKKKNLVEAASLVDLKAELYRKKEDFKKQKAQSADQYARPKPVEKKLDIFSRKNKGVEQRSNKDATHQRLEEDVYENSRKSLEIKAKLYEQMMNSSDIPDEDGSKRYLVDFEQKVVDNIMIQRDKEREKLKREEQQRLEREEEELLSKIEIPPPKEEGEEWVDYVDSFGRSRRCMKKDLATVKEKDRKSQKFIRPGQDTGNSMQNTSNQSSSLVSEDMLREEQRKKWEEEEQRNFEAGPIHYANVQFDEKRFHGTGFFQFAKDDAVRQEQLDVLNSMRKKTVEERGKREKLLEKRKAMLDARLAKVKQRRKMKEGIETEEETEGLIGPKVKEMVSEKSEKNSEPELLTRDESIKEKAMKTREWDKGKERMHQQMESYEEKYFKDRRDERIEEFAPPNFYYDTNHKGKNSGNQKNIEEHLMPVHPPGELDSGDKIDSFLKKIRGNVGNAQHNMQGISVNHSSTNNIIDIPLPGESKEVADGGHNSPGIPCSSAVSSADASGSDVSSFILPNLSVPPPMYSQPDIPYPGTTSNLGGYPLCMPSIHMPLGHEATTLDSKPIELETCGSSLGNIESSFTGVSGSTGANERFISKHVGPYPLGNEQTPYWSAQPTPMNTGTNFQNLLQQPIVSNTLSKPNQSSGRLRKYLNLSGSENKTTVMDNRLVRHEPEQDSNETLETASRQSTIHNSTASSVSDTSSVCADGTVFESAPVRYDN